VTRVDPRIERLADLPGAHGGFVLALADLDADLLRADRKRAAARQRLEGGTAGGVGVGARIDLAVDQDWSSPAMRAMERISALASARGRTSFPAETMLSQLGEVNILNVGFEDLWITAVSAVQAERLGSICIILDASDNVGTCFLGSNVEASGS
jgi:hypothetical protein